jgi:Fic family protein
MLKFPRPVATTKFKEQIQQLDILRQTLINIPLAAKQAQHVFHRQLFKSSLFSARIEGNLLTMADEPAINLNNPQQKKSLELANIASAYQRLTKIDQLDLSELKALHHSIMKDLSPNAGQLRGEASAIFDQHGNIVYLTPEPSTAKEMLEVLFTQLNSLADGLAEQLNLIINCHYYFEKIHPFVDGNGRTGRALMHWQFKKYRLFGDYLLPLEEYFDNHREAYYFHLEKNTTNTKAFYQFFLDSIIWSLTKQLEEIKNLSLDKPQTGLLPRRQEILDIITDHPYCSADFIARRFPTMSSRTIQYDLAQLVKEKLITKHGQTKGVVYSPAN